MEKSRTIYCPTCGRRVATYDGKSKTNIIVNCRKCNKRVVYNINSGNTESKRIPQRNTSSGKTFY